MSSYMIRGGKPLSGTVRASGNKNAALPCIAASILTSEEVILKNIPEIEDVKMMLSVASSVGTRVTRLGEGTYSLKTEKLSTEVIGEHAASIRASILFAGPILSRKGKVHLVPPGGDVIGMRRLDTHFLAFQSLGASSEIDRDRMISIKADRLTGGTIFLDEASVTATENALTACVLAEGVSVIRNAASEPHIQDLCRLLNMMGARIEGIGSNLLRIQGVDELHGTQMEIGPDYMEIGSFIGLAAATGGEITITQTNPEDLQMVRLGYRRLGISWEQDGTTLRVPRNQSRCIVPDVSSMVPKIEDAPWPGFPADLLSIITVAATQVSGTVLVHEKMFESRMYFVDMLIRMGAQIILCDPHRAVVTGPALLRGSLLTSPDVRAGMALVIAALAAEGESEIQNVYQIERGYEHLCEKLSSLGADIQRVP
jgi:UDP-N-acetylglucosamine 1-carboxyvinyltransferase